MYYIINFKSHWFYFIFSNISLFDDNIVIKTISNNQLLKSCQMIKFDFIAYMKEKLRRNYIPAFYI